MKESLHNHFWYYVSFLFVEAVSLCIIFTFTYDRFIQVMALLVMIGFYLIWTLVHHHLHHTLTKKIVLEYILIGAVGMIALLFIFL